MAWQDQLKGDSLAWLLEPDDPGVRYLALRDLLDRPADDAELLAAQQAAHAQGPIATDPRRDGAGGLLGGAGAGLQPEVPLHRLVDHPAGATGRIRGAQDERIGRACAYLLDHALTPGGQFTHVRRAIGHGRLPAGQPVLGAARTGLRRSAAGRGFRLDGAQRDRRRDRPGQRARRGRCATTPASAAPGSPAAQTTSCRAPGARSR